MTLSYRDGVAVGQLAFYCPAILIGAYLTIVHPFHTTGWIDIVFFSLIRIVGSAVQLCTLNDPNSTKLYTVSAIMNSIGLAPLLAGSLGLLDRINEDLGKDHRRATHVPRYVFRVVQTSIILGLILGIVGGVRAGHTYGHSGNFTIDKIGKAGTGLLVGGFVANVFITFLTSLQSSRIKPGQKRLLIAVAAAIPFLCIRTVYSIMATLTNNSNIKLIGGSTTDWLCLAVIEEIVVIFIYIAAGLSVR